MHGISNIGIDVIGHEGTAPANDQARDGVIADNVVYDCRSSYATAAGIYVDGARDLTIERNRVRACQWGIEIGCEAVGETTSRITVRDNFVYANDDAGLAIGGFDYPGGSGRVVDCTVAGNSFHGNDRATAAPGGVTGALNVSDTEGVAIVGNVFSLDSPDGLALYVESVGVGLALDYNLWFEAGGATAYYEYGGDVYTAFADFQAGTGQEANAVTGDPRFVDASAGDLHLGGDSPARDAGDPAARGLGAADFDGDVRVQGERADIGADETGGASPVRDPGFRQNVWAVAGAGAGELAVHGLPAGAGLTVYDAGGRAVFAAAEGAIAAAAAGQAVVPTAGWPVGVYTLRWMVGGSAQAGSLRVALLR